MRTLNLALGIIFSFGFSTTTFAAEDIYKTSKELRRKENKENKVKEVPTLAVSAPTPKIGREVNCTTDTGETLQNTDQRFEQCLVDTKKPTKVKGR